MKNKQLQILYQLLYKKTDVVEHTKNTLKQVSQPNQCRSCMETDKSHMSLIERKHTLTTPQNQPTERGTVRKLSGVTHA